MAFFRHPVIRLVVTATIACVFSFVLGYVIATEKSMPRVHKLQFPLMLAGAGAANHHYLLPAGTNLYYDQAFPEGFVRYKVYVNVEGVKLESHEVNEKFWLEPLTAFPVGAEQLQKLLQEHPLSRDDMAAILKSGVLSKEEIRSLLEEFSR